MLDTALSLLMLAAIALFAGAAFLFRRGERKRPVLMLTLAGVMVMNLIIWTLPDKSGGTLADAAKQGAPQ
ncbi:MAG: hypothetical protein B7Y36_10640 [Novosphingobium sp. 28-62-57]|uniref:hypothetical protein n=1 Tax=unclassified Novosphingobium TaxID=2644732 RepID=UPI000BCB258B|nr:MULTISPECIES: hypothetical protein [unclassified Novosphingobium]OYW48649.1 MAG: hypothetical protein B7Z34_13065 [Novosphingobium sp. 12-62-10]OYZ10201.1 MAG: hypothetical protein B7Y36_10640 [Novosphingobium sp. 28-62-57]OZA32223.1 MAG: hypothetical protein B7X92_12735 [Novosphingobium sp. 17-62-9]HQS71562.1 hypothetical protein [Novosphingobium sp.]